MNLTWGEAVLLTVAGIVWLASVAAMVWMVTHL